MVSIDPTAAPGAASAPARAHPFYFAAWRWHFYAGLYVIPFLMMLAVTGLIMLWTSALTGRDGEWIAVTPQATALPVSAQAQAALAAVPDSTLQGYIAPRAADLAAIVRLGLGEDSVMVAVDPYTAQVLAQFPRRQGLYDIADTIHGTLYLDTLGDRLIEIAASLGVIMVVTGVYLWWPRQGGVLRALLPDLTARGRGLWKSLHASAGIWIALVLMVFLISGLSWAGIWGDRYVQAWSTFPAAKWDNVPLSDTTHAAMNHGVKEVPWALEQTPMPASGSDAGAPGIAPGQGVDLDGVVAFARANGFDGRFQLMAPEGDSGVWTISRNSMSNDSADPTSDRTLHLDRYSGKVLADVRFADYSTYGQAMAVGIAFHEGDLGVWNIAFNTAFCLLVLFVCVSGAVMWWKRRPDGAARLAAPPMPRDLPMWKGAVVLMLALSFAFPMAGLTLLVVMALDLLLVSRLPALKRALS